MTKEQIAQDITELLGVPAVHFSTGSTEPKELFLQIVDSLGLNLSSTLTKQELAREIVTKAGFAWNDDFESAGGTVTLKGLEAVRAAVNFFLRP